MKPWSQTHPRAFLLVIWALIFAALNLVSYDAPVAITRFLLAFCSGLILLELLLTRARRRDRS